MDSTRVGSSGWDGESTGRGSRVDGREGKPGRVGMWLLSMQGTTRRSFDLEGWTCDGILPVVPACLPGMD